MRQWKFTQDKVANCTGSDGYIASKPFHNALSFTFLNACNNGGVDVFLINDVGHS